MAKEFKRSGAHPSKGKKTAVTKRGTGRDSEDKPFFGKKKSFREEPEKKFREKKSTDTQKSSFNEDKSSFERYRENAPAKGKRATTVNKERNRHSEDASVADKKKGFRDRNDHSEREDYNREGTSDGPKSRFKKDNERSSFERYRDNAKPSDFGTGRKRDHSNQAEKKYSSEERSFKRKPDSEERPAFKRKKEDRKDDDRSYERKTNEAERSNFKRKEGTTSFRRTTSSDKPDYSKKKTVNPYDLDEADLEYGKEKSFKKKGLAYEKKPYVKKGTSFKKKGDSKPAREKDDGMMRLNKYISNAGICSRREADELISSGVVQVNGQTITEMGFRVKPSDIIKYGGQTLKKERMVYLVLNKPKDYITTVDDPQKRRTVLELVQNACKERIYPVGRLDRSTTGLLMFTNDGELTKKLTHPRYGIKKIYHVELDKPLKRQDMDQITEGLELEDGEIKVDEISYVGDGKDKTQIGVELHSGKNRIVRRIFEHMGYNVRKLDRVMFGSLTKKDLPRGRWRFLTDAEVGILNMISSD